jgi:hypothetical protein
VFAIGVLPIPSFPRDDDAELEGTEAIAEFLGKTKQETAALLSRHRAGPAFKFAGKWRMKPSEWYAWRQKQIEANLAKGAAWKAANTQPIQVKAHNRKRGWRGSSAAADAPAAISAAPTPK